MTAGSLARPSRPARLCLWALLALATLGCPAADGDGADSGATDIFVVGLVNQGGLTGIGVPERLSDRDAYDNQPAFLDRGDCLVWSSRRGLQTDVVGHCFGTRDRERRTLTLESEYSPKALPWGAGFSAVRVEQDGRQRLWAFDEAPGELPRLLAPSPEYVAYHAWIDEQTVALGVLGPSLTLHVLDLESGRLREVQAGVGRALESVPGRRAVSYAARAGDGTDWLYVFDADTGTSYPLVDALPGSEDHAWTPDGLVLMGREATLYARDPEDADGDWFVLADFAAEGLAGITRLAVSPSGERIAVVAGH